MSKTSVFSIVIALIISSIVFSQEKNDEKKDDKDAKKSGKEKIADALKNTSLQEGIFKVYQDSTDGTVKILLESKDLNKDFIYFSQFNNGIAQFGLRRGHYLNSLVFKIEKKYNRIEFVRQNTSYYFDPESALYRSRDANINNPILASIKIEASDAEKGQYLIKADELFLNDTFFQVKPESKDKSGDAFKLGSISKDKSSISEIKNYSDNLNIKADWVYSQNSANNNGGSSVLDARNVTVQVFHSIIAVPQNNYQPRFDDPRIGYFLTFVDDQTSRETVNYRDMIHRWNLEKKDAAELSEPVKPITWWIENSTPVEFRDLVRQGVLKWNKAFEKAGFKNAMEVKVQPDDADWDAGDIHYNVLRWTSSPITAFGGLGPSFVNPLTGEILGADIMLEFVHHTNRVFYSQLYDAEAIAELDPNEYSYCSAGHLMQQNRLLAQTVMEAKDLPAFELDRLQKEAMLELVMHEIGHTLGLNHNMKASYLYTPEQLYDKNFAKDRCLSGSIMDYMAANLNPNQEEQGAYYSSNIGPYDIWAIQYGYTPNLSESQLKAIAERSNEPELIFGNDADDMRLPGKAMDPRVMINDLSNDPIRFASNTMDLILSTYPQIENKLTQPGEFYEDFHRGFDILMSSYWNANNVISRWVGGVYINRSTIGQKGKTDTYIPVEYDKQKQAMNTLSKYAFSDKAYDIPPSLFRNYAKQRRGFDINSNGDDIKIHQMILNYQKRIIQHLINPSTLERFVNTEKYGNQYSINEMMTDLTDAIFKADIKGTVSTYRQNLQDTYVSMLLNDYQIGRLNSVEKSAILAQLLNIQKMCKNKSGDAVSKAHKQRLYMQIQEGIKPKSKA